MPALGFIRRQRAENHGYWIILPEHLRLKSRAVQDGVPMHTGICGPGNEDTKVKNTRKKKETNYE